MAVADNAIVGAVIAFRSQDNPNDIYIQDMMTHPDHRRRGIARMLINRIRSQAEAWGYKRLYLTSEPDNRAAYNSWVAYGFQNISGDHKINGISVISNLKGSGRDRAVYQLGL